MNTSRSVVSRLLSAAQFISGAVPEPEPEEGFRVDRKETWGKSRPEQSQG